MDTRGWADIAYNFLICRHNWLFEGRGWGRRSAAQGTNDGNRDYLAVCFLGGDAKGRDDVTDEGRQALAYLIDHDGPLHNVPRIVRPHSSFHATSCPGDELRAFAAGRWPSR